MAASIPVFSPDGKRLFIDGFLDRREFLGYDLESGLVTPVLNEVSGAELEYSKDGKWVTYVSIPDRSLWRAAADGSQRVQLTNSPLIAYVPHWSPDGKQIAFYGGPPGLPERIYTVPFEGGVVQQVTHGEAGAYGDGYFSWSADSASIIFGSPRMLEPGKTRLHRIDLKTVSVSTLADSEELWAPRCSPDGHYIAALAGKKWALKLYDVATRKQTETLVEHATWPSWSRDGQSIFFIDTVDETHWWRYRIGERKPEAIVSLKKTPVGMDDWFALGLNNTLITARDTGTDEFYALDWDAN